MPAPNFNWPTIYASFKKSALSKQCFYDQRLADFIPGNRRKPTLGLMIAEFNKIEDTLKTVTGSSGSEFVSVVDLESSSSHSSQLSEIQIKLPDGTAIWMKTADPLTLVLKLHEQCRICDEN